MMMKMMMIMMRMMVIRMILLLMMIMMSLNPVVSLGTVLRDMQKFYQMLIITQMITIILLTITQIITTDSTNNQF